VPPAGSKTGVETAFNRCHARIPVHRRVPGNPAQGVSCTDEFGKAQFRAAPARVWYGPDREYPRIADEDRAERIEVITGITA